MEKRCLCLLLLFFETLFVNICVAKQLVQYDNNLSQEQTLDASNELPFYFGEVRSMYTFDYTVSQTSINKTVKVASSMGLMTYNSKTKKYNLCSVERAAADGYTWPTPATSTYPKGHSITASDGEHLLNESEEMVKIPFSPNIEIIALADYDPTDEAGVHFEGIHSGYGKVRKNHLYESVGYTGCSDIDGYGAIPMPATHYVHYNESIKIDFIETHYTYTLDSNTFDMVASDEFLDDLNLHYEYKIVDYVLDDSNISESTYISQDNSNPALFYPRSVTGNGMQVTNRPAGRDAVGHEPLIRVDLVYTQPETGAKVIVRYGYIKIRIIDYSDMEATINLSDIYMNSGDEARVTWSQMKSLVLNKIGFNDSQKQEFEEKYYLEVADASVKDMPNTVNGALYTTAFTNKRYANRYYKTDDGDYKQSMNTYDDNLSKMKSYSVENNWFGRIWYKPHSSSKSTDWDDDATVLVWNLGTDVPNASNMTPTAYENFLIKAGASYSSKGLNTKSVSSVVRFVNKENGTSIWVTLNFLVGTIHFACGDINNRVIDHWYDYKQGYRDNTADTIEVYANVPTPSEVSQAALVYNSFQKDLKDHWLGKKVSLSINDSERFNKFTASSSLYISFEFRLPMAGINTVDISADSKGRWAVDGFSGNVYTLYLNAAKNQIWAAKNIDAGMTSDELICSLTADGIISFNSRSNNSVQSVAATDILNLIGMYDATGKYQKDVYLTGHAKRTFTAYVEIKVGSDSYAPLIGKNYFNVRFLRPINVWPAERNVTNVLNKTEFINIWELLYIRDWRTYAVVMDKMTQKFGDKAVSGTGLDGKTYGKKDVVFFDEGNVPYSFYGISNLYVNREEIRSDAYLETTKRVKLTNSVEIESLNRISQITALTNGSLQYLKIIDKANAGDNYSVAGISGKSVTNTPNDIIAYTENGGITGPFHIYVPIAVDYLWGVTPKHTQKVWSVITITPPTSYSLSITASGNGNVMYNNTAVRNSTQSFTLNEGTSATISITPDSGYKIASLYVNNINMTSSIANNSYTISNISKNTTVEVVFEAIPVTTYSLSITASGNGSVTYNGTTARNNTRSITVNAGTSASISITPDSGYKIASLYVNNINMTSSITNNSYTISSISKNTTVEVAFEAIPVTTYSLSITASGNGSVTYNGTTARNNTRSITVNEGTSATISITPDSGYRVASLYVNNINMTSSIANNSYTISNISKNTTVSVTFEAETSGYDITPYVSALSIGGAYTQTNDLINSGSQLNWQFTNKSAYSVTLKSMQLIDGKSGVGGNIMTVNKLVEAGTSVSYSTTIGALGIYLPVTCRFRYEYNNVEYSTDAVFAGSPKFTMSIKSTGNGSVGYGGVTVRNETKTFSVDHLSSVTFTFSPDSGNRLKSVKVNSKDVTSSISNNRYTESFVTSNLNVVVEFETIETVALNITVTGNGSITYNKTVVRDETQSFSINKGDDATILFSSDKGYNIKSVKLDNTDVTAEISNNSYTVKNITDNVALNVLFENLTDSLHNEIVSLINQQAETVLDNNVKITKLQECLIDLSVKYKDNEAATKLNIEIANKLSDFSGREFYLEERLMTLNKTLIAIEAGNYSNVNDRLTELLDELKKNKKDIDALNEELTELENRILDFIESQPFVSDGVTFAVVSKEERKLSVTTGDYGHVLRVPATVTQNGTTWTVTGIETDALKDNTELAAVVWEPSVAFTATVNNPNLLLYVRSANYAPAAIKNVVVNGTANSITLTDAATGNNFYCPQSFTARTISYQHTYGMTTGIGESRGWETISLPFDVQNISHKTKGTIVPFAQWNGGDAVRPFWLYELTGMGFVEAGSIKANTPYIISMPNNGRYDSQWLLSGTVTFSASSVLVAETENLHTAYYLDRTFVPNFTEKGESEGLYALNVNNVYTTDHSGMPEGSKFVLNMRPIHPFEAYMTTASNARQMIDVFEGMTTEITGIYEIPSEKGAVYDLQGRRVAGVKKGVYIKDGKKVIVK